VYHKGLNHGLAGLLQCRPLEHVQQADNPAVDIGHPDAVVWRLRKVVEAVPNLPFVHLIAELPQQRGHGRKIGRPGVSNDHCGFVLPGRLAAKVGLRDGP